MSKNKTKGGKNILALFIRKAKESFPPSGKGISKEKVIKELPIIAGIGALAVIITVGSGRFANGTAINGIDVSGKKAGAVQEILNEEALPSLKCVITVPDGTKYEIKQADISWEYSKDKIKEPIKEQKAEEKPKGGTFSYELAPTYDEASLKKQIEKSGLTDGERQPTDAKLDKNSDGEFVIIPEDPGNVLLDKEKAVSAILQAFKYACDSKEYENISITLPRDFYKRAAVESDNPRLVQQKEELNAIAFRSLDIDVHGGVMEKIYLKDYADIDFNGDYEINRDKLSSYVDKLAEKYDTIGIDRKLKLPNGKTYEIKGTEKDTYGYHMDKEATVEEILDAIQNGRSEIFTINYTGGRERGTNGTDVGETYIFVNLTTQKLTAVKDGEVLLESDFVSGLDSDPKRRTPEGTYSIREHETATTLTGRDGEGEYNTYVNYWMALDYTGVGLHDAGWRDKFGGSIYKTDGSHGCVNLPVEVAQTLFYNYDLGDPVFLYREPEGQQKTSVVPGK